jgi:hypothetical protein
MPIIRLRALINGFELDGIRLKKAIQQSFFSSSDSAKDASDCVFNHQIRQSNHQILDMD